MGRWIIIPDKIVIAIKEEFTEGKIEFDIVGFYQVLKEFANIDLKEVNRRVWQFYQDNKIPSDTTIARALNLRKTDNGVIETNKYLLNLLCFYAFKKSWTETLSDLSIDSQQLMRRGKEREKKENKLTEEGLPIGMVLSKENKVSEIIEPKQNLSPEIEKEGGSPKTEENKKKKVDSYSVSEIENIVRNIKLKIYGSSSEDLKKIKDIEKYISVADSDGLEDVKLLLTHSKERILQRIELWERWAKNPVDENMYNMARTCLIMLFRVMNLKEIKATEIIKPQNRGETLTNSDNEKSSVEQVKPIYTPMQNEKKENKKEDKVSQPEQEVETWTAEDEARQLKAEELQIARLEKIRIKTNKPLTKDVKIDFYMIPKITSKWIKVRGNKIIISNSTNKIVFDFQRNTISGSVGVDWESITYYILNRYRRTINYKKTIEKFLKVNAIYRFNSIEYRDVIKRINFLPDDFTILDFSLNYRNFSKFDLTFAIGHPKEKRTQFHILVLEDFTYEQLESLYLFYVYLLAYILGKEVKELIDINYLKEIGQKRIDVEVSIEDLN